MRNPFSILRTFCLMTAGLIGAICVSMWLSHTLVERVGSNIWPDNAHPPAPSLWEWEQRLNLFIAASSPRIVFVGPCYAGALDGDFKHKGIYNIASGGDWSKTQSHLLRRYIRPEDLVVVVFTLRDINIGTNSRLHLSMTSARIRDMEIAKGIIGKWLGLPLPYPSHPFVASQSEIKALCSWVDIDKFPNLDIHNTVANMRSHATEREVAEFLSKFSWHKNTLFVLHPTMGSSLPDTEFARNERMMKTIVLNSVNTADASCLFDTSPDMFRSVWHVTSPAHHHVAEFIIAYL